MPIHALFVGGTIDNSALDLDGTAIDGSGRVRPHTCAAVAHARAKGVEVVVLNRGDDTSFEEDLAKDVLEIITVFSARLYGSRSRKNQRLIDTVKKAAEDAQG